ncbi:11S globulin seed storage protein Ana o 2.0101-like [Rutidosis leptorrhynchoides]|uniref:11S globulin seed storage protein Ana o 2.0101-like n=1 Tax=Rutidosis leptorrhynchoides TaxID=125765 RepID=UPI003A9991E9
MGSSHRPLGICIFLVLFHGCLSQITAPCMQTQQPSRLSGRSDCQIDRIIAREPNRRVESQAGVSEFFESFENDELECAGVEAVRHTIYPKGLLLPYYPSAPELVYVVRGSGIQGTVLPGCPETFETSFPSGSGQQQFSDKHQKVYRYREGDILALPAGAVHWTYNDGETPIVTIVLRDTSNVANQLDRNFRKFFLAGNPQSQQGQQPWGSQQRPSGSQGQQADPCEVCRRLRGELVLDSPCAANCNKFTMQQGQADQGFNIFNGFDEEILQLVFNVEYETVTKLQGQYDNRGLIVRADNFNVVVPDEQEQQQFSPRGRGNGLEETLCSTQLSANIASPTRADVYNPRGGRVSKLNSFKLPVLNMLQLSAERGVLYKNAVLAPHYNLNAHSVIYITSGSSRLQIVRNDGSSVFDDVVREGQLIVVPQDFAVIKKAGEQGCEWIAFKTNENAMTTQLAGRYSYIRELPEEVLANSYDISRQQAKSLKYNRQEGVVLSPQSGSTMTKAKNTLLSAIFG